MDWCVILGPGNKSLVFFGGGGGGGGGFPLLGGSN